MAEMRGAVWIRGPTTTNFRRLMGAGGAPSDGRLSPSRSFRLKKLHHQLRRYGVLPYCSLCGREIPIN
jgi:hypothetical protein